MGYRQKATKKRKFAEKRQRQAAMQSEGLEQGMLGPEVILHTKTSRQKSRRWGFDVFITKDITGSVDPDLSDPVPSEGTKQTYRFASQSMLIGSMSQAKAAAIEIQEDLLKSRQHGGDVIRVIPVPYETISPSIQNQLDGLNDMTRLLNLAYELVVEDFINGKSPASLDIGEAKRAYYAKAVEILKPKKPAIDTSTVGTDPTTRSTDTDERSSAERLEAIKAAASIPESEEGQPSEISEVTPTGE